MDRVVGFEELGSKDDFTTRTLELRIAKKGIIASTDLQENTVANVPPKPSIRQSDYVGVNDEDQDDA